MERQNQEPQEETPRREELHRVIHKTRNTPIQGPDDQPRPTKIEENLGESKTPGDFESESTSTNNFIDVPPIKFKRYLGAQESATDKRGKRATYRPISRGT